MADTERLRRALPMRSRRQKNRAAERTVRLGEVVNSLFEGQVAPRQDIFESVVVVWEQLLPAELRQHCKLAGISGGQLKVLMDSPVYLHELRLCGAELTRELQRRCPKARIRTIKFSIG